MKYDTIIIGAGLGGLTAGAKLAKEGKKVLLIEQHNIVGGCATTIMGHNGFKHEVGFHKIDGLDTEDFKNKILEDLGIFKNINFIKIPEFYRFKNQRVDIVIPYEYKKATEILIKNFPSEKKGILKYFKVILRIRKETKTIPIKMWQLLCLFPLLPFLYPNVILNARKTIGDFLDSIIKNEDLKLTLLATIKYYHDDPHALSLLFYAMAQGSFFSGGAYYIKGGSQKLSDYLGSIIKKNNGEILLNSLVTKIITEEERTIGVLYRHTSKKDEKEIRIFANNIIANASVPITVGNLLYTKNMVKFKKVIKNLKTSFSYFSIYFGFKKPVKQLGNKYYSTFVFHEDIWKTSELIVNHKSHDYSKRNFVFVDYSQIDSDLAPKDKSVGVINVIDYYDNWINLCDKEYKEKKERIASVFIDRLNKLIPGIKNEIEFYKISTPKTIHRYTLNPHGTPYGFAQIPNQAGLNRIGNISPIKNLYFASAWTMPGGGFTGAMISGYTSAEEILKKKNHK